MVRYWQMLWLDHLLHGRGKLGVNPVFLSDKMGLTVTKTATL